MNGLFTLVLNDENGRTEATVLSVLSGKTIASATNVSAWSAAVDAVADAMLIFEGGYVG